MTATAATTPATDTTQWLHQLYGHAETGWLTLFTLNRTSGARTTSWAPVDDLDALATAATHHEPTSCVWFGVATRTQRLGNGQRGGAEHCHAIPGLWLDIDIEGPGHKGGYQLAADRAAAHNLVARFPLPPTTVIDSGGGLQAWWLFPELVDLTDTGTLLAAWGATWARHGHDAGIHVDNVFEPARVMRLPGTTNRKDGLARPVTIVTANWTTRYGTDDLEQHLDAPPAPPTATPHTGIALVPYIGPQRPGDAYNARHSGADVLSAAGFTLARRAHNGEEHWVRPGKDARDGTSATIYPDDGHTTIWSDTCRQQYPGIELRRPYDPFGLHAAINHRGDIADATRALRAQGYGEPPATTTTAAVAGQVATVADQPWPDPIPLEQPTTFPDVPIDAYPAWIADQIRNVTDQLQCDPMLPAVFALGALSVASLGHLHLAVRSGETMRSTGLYLAASGPPASGKSPALDFMMDPVRDFETNAIAMAAREVAKAEAQRAIADKRAKEAIDNAARLDEPEKRAEAVRLKAEAADMTVPPTGELITGDITPERLATLMLANDERIAIVSDEAGVLDIDRYGDKGAGKKMDLYLQGFTGQAATVHRQNAPTIRLRHPLLAICAGVQPHALAAAMADPEFRNRGLGSRFLTATTTQLASNTDIDRDVWDAAVGANYAQQLGALATQWDTWDAPGTVHLDAEARREFSAWAATIKDRQEPGGPLESEGGWASKLRTSALRIAVLFHLADGAAYSEPVPASVMERAIEVAEYFVAHHLYEVNDAAGDAAKLLTSMVKIATERDGNGEVSRATTPFVARRELGKRGPRHMRTIEAFSPVLEILVDHGWARLAGVTGPPNQQFTQQVRAAAAIELHPAALTRDSARHARHIATTAQAAGNEMQRDGDGVARVARVAYRGLLDPSLSVAKSDTTQTLRDTRDTRDESEPHVIPPPDPLASTPFGHDPQGAP